MTSKDIDINNFDNEIPYTNENMKKYINRILQNNKCNEVCTRMTMNFYQSYGPNRILICGYNSKDVIKEYNIIHDEIINKYF